MTSVFRQKVNCYLPVEEEPQAEEVTQEFERDAKKLLNAALGTTGQCIYRVSLIRSDLRRKCGLVAERDFMWRTENIISWRGGGYMNFVQINT